MPWQDALLLETGPWDDSPGLFLPTKILDLCFATMPTPSPQISKLIALLAWVKLDEVSEYFTKLRDQLKNTMDCDEERERWKAHPLYSKNTKEQLEKLCHSLKIPVTPALTKHQLATLIMKKRGDPEPKAVSQTLSLSEFPDTVTGINHLPVGKLRRVLHQHNFPITGSKDQLVLREYLLRHRRTAAIAAREEEQVKDLVRVYKLLILAQKKCSTSTSIKREHFR